MKVFIPDIIKRCLKPIPWRPFRSAICYNSESFGLFYHGADFSPIKNSNPFIRKVGSLPTAATNRNYLLLGKQLLLGCLLVFFSIQLAQAQQQLVLKKLGSKRRYVFKEGEEIKIKLKDSGEVLRGKWYWEDPQTIIVAWQEVKLPNIHWLDISQKEKGIYLLRKGQDLLLLAGLGYFTVTQANSLLIGEGFNVGERVYRPSLLLVGGGLVCSSLDRLFRPRKVKIGQNRFSLSLIETF